jgi:hypothetical protein
VQRLVKCGELEFAKVAFGGFRLCGLLATCIVVQEDAVDDLTDGHMLGFRLDLFDRRPFDVPSPLFAGVGVLPRT